MHQSVALLAEGVDRNESDIGEQTMTFDVALLAEGVDRNNTSQGMLNLTTVALLAEGVDRNTEISESATIPYVALLAEGVDRNRLHWGSCALQRSRPPRGGRG